MSIDYKIYSIGLDGHIEKRHDCWAQEDFHALSQARRISGPGDVEVWQGARFVARVARDAATSPKEMAAHWTGLKALG
jgi:hypothetical protein